MTTEATPGALGSNDQLGLVERLRTDVMWHQRRGNDTIARDCKEAADEIERLRDEALRFDREPPPDCKCASQCIARGACGRKCSMALWPNAELTGDQGP